MFCFKCHKLLFSGNLVEVYIAQLRALNLGLDYILDDLLEFSNEMTNSVKGFDWSSDEGQTYLRGRLFEKVNIEYGHVQSNKKSSDVAGTSKDNNMSTSDIKAEMMEDSVISKIDEIDPTLPRTIAQIENVEIVNSKSVVERKQQIFKDFIGGKLVKPLKVCTGCTSRKAGMNVINRSLIILTASKAATSVAKFNSDDQDGQGNEASSINIEMKGKSYLTPSQAREHMRRLWKNEQPTLERIFPFINFEKKGEAKDPIGSTDCPLDVFFWETIIVSPNRFRPLVPCRS